MHGSLVTILVVLAWAFAPAVESQGKSGTATVSRQEVLLPQKPALPDPQLSSDMPLTQAISFAWRYSQGDTAGLVSRIWMRVDQGDWLLLPERTAPGATSYRYDKAQPGRLYCFKVEPEGRVTVGNTAPCIRVPDALEIRDFTIRIE